MQALSEPATKASEFSEQIDETMAGTITKVISLLSFSSLLPLKDRPQKKNALFVITKPGEKALSVNQIGRMQTPTYDRYTQVISKLIGKINNQSKIILPSNIVSTIFTKEKHLILVGQRPPLGRACLLAAAVKTNFMSCSEAWQEDNEIFKIIFSAREIWNAM